MFPGLDANVLENKLPAQRGRTFPILTYTFVMAAKERNVRQKYEIQIFVKNSTFFFPFSIVVWSNQGV